MLYVKNLVECQVIRNSGGGFAEHIRHNGIKRHIANSKGILKTVLLTVFHRSEFVAITGQFPQNTDILSWDKAAFHQTDVEQVPNPFGVLCIVFISLYRFHSFGISNDDTDAPLFQNVEHRNLVFSRGFHAHIQTVVFVEPVSKPIQICIKRRKALFSGNLAANCPLAF